MLNNINITKLDSLIQYILQNYSNLQETRNSQHQPLDLLILLILNQSCTDNMADKAFKNLHNHYSNYQEILDEYNPARLTQLIKICGLSKTKSQYILNTLEFLATYYSLDIQMDFLQELSNTEAIKLITSIKGIGVKSASCMLVFGKGLRRNVFAIDTHIGRIFKRLAIFPETISIANAHYPVQAVFDKYDNINPAPAYTVHVALVEHGRHICYARKPQCHKCDLQNYCNYFQ